MGRRSKQGASLRATRRANAANRQLEHALADRSEETRVRDKDDAELFVLDTSRHDGARAGPRRIRRSGGRGGGEGGDDDDEDEKANKRRRYRTEHSEREERMIRRLIRVHGRDGTIALAEAGRARSAGGRTGRLTSTGILAATGPSFDLWGDAPPPTTTTAASTTRRRSAGPPSGADDVGGAKKVGVGGVVVPSPPRLAVEVAHPGQSYRPDAEHHQEAIGVALSIEIRRNEAAEYKERPVSDGMSAYAREFMVDGDTDDDDTDDDDESGEEEDGKDGVATSTRTTIVKKRKGKLTRAQRNKQRRVKAEMVEIRERKARRAFLHQANEVRAHDEALRRAERVAAERRSEVERLRAERLSRPLGSDVWGALSRRDPISAPALPVALTEELSGRTDGIGGGGGSLRKVVPKGSLVTDRVESMAARNMIVKRKASEGRRIVQGKKRTNRVRGAEGGTEYMLM
ncbi:hypothetical protein ACHAW5_005027 [Stephanodiscus triporus]|uniref:Ribosome biogenesis protein NOP53 n=1 Tax=Stephanodiscus triporus TaxID=2934178 RepID=A0ABD3NNY7_9STRA